ncbi:MAG: carboxypeptidase-like regulatory domain-containing protein, partial [Planctomycetota bacterium]
MSTIAAKVITTAAVVAISIGGIITYKQVTKPESPQAEMIVQQQEQGTEGNIQEKSTEPATHETANLSTIDKAKDNLKQAQPIVSSPIPVLARKDNFKFKPKGVLSGQITDIETGQPVTDARVKINIGPIFEAVTDPNGFYYFKSIDTDGNYEIRVITKEYVCLTDYRSLPTVY